MVPINNTDAYWTNKTKMIVSRDPSTNHHDKSRWLSHMLRPIEFACLSFES